MKRSLRIAAIGLSVAAAVGVAAALFVKTRPASLEEHNRIESRLGSLQLLNARIAQQALAVRHGLTPHYDELTRSTQSFAEQARLLQGDLTEQRGESPELDAALEQMQRESAHRGEAVERFKQQNSVLKNSLYYLPLAASQVQSELATRAGPPTMLDASDSPAEPSQPESLGDAVSRLVQAVLTQNLLGGREEAAAVSRLLESLGGMKSQVPEASRRRFQLLLAHAKTASSAQVDVDPLLREQILESQVGTALSAVEDAYDQVFEATLERASRYRSVLYGWSVLLLLGVLGAGWQLRSVYRHLDQLVRERTARLNEAIDELWGEMELAKKIQTALVPRKPVLRDCEVAAVMRPTDHVGGDYYDVIEVDGTEWVLIGDVSGHGVSAGLVMMMCQTAVHSVLTSHPNVEPDELLATVNRTLTRNLELLGEDKYMTISALRRDLDGRFTVAGMHQDLLVYRSQSRQVEHLPAQGTWLGLSSDIRALLPVRKLELAPGDVLVLYTDGITEARRDGDMLDVGGLRDTVAAVGTESAQGILDSILDKLTGYEVSDDVAAVVIKRRDPEKAVGYHAA